MHRSPRTLLFVFMLSFFLPFKSFAWNALGHMVITQIAYERLTPVAKNKVDNLVSYFAKEYPNTPTLLQMAIWPDAVRAQKIDMFTRWHYIDVPFSDDGTKLDDDTIATDNAAWALNTIKSVVKNDQANSYERARFLAFTIHIVGDLHQPLHTVTRITEKHPTGDKGGNLFYIANSHSKMNLHKLWDGGIDVLTGSNKADDVKVLANDLTQRYPLSEMEQQANNLKVEDWEQEGMRNALNYVYNTKENEPVSTAYRKAGTQIVEKELALAGYRLANLLNILLG